MRRLTAVLVAVMFAVPIATVYPVDIANSSNSLELAGGKYGRTLFSEKQNVK